jgi:tripartite-type tricarboxylate transporter receptor subunit TctC
VLIKLSLQLRHAVFASSPKADKGTLPVARLLPANNLTEFIALLKQNGTKMQYGSAGVGSTTHLACALLNARIGVEVTHIPYRGGGPLANDLIGGQIDYMCGNMGSSAVRVAAKQSKPLALLSRERTPLMPELATAHE